MHKYKSLVRFTLVGALNTGVDFLLFYLLANVFGAGYLLAQTLSYSAGIVCSYYLNRLWAFDDTTPAEKPAIQFLQFAVVNVLCLGFSVAGLGLAIKLGVAVYAAKVAMTASPWLLRYLVYKLWIFRAVSPVEEGYMAIAPSFDNPTVPQDGR